MRVGRSYHSRQKRTKKASSPVKLNNQLKNGDVREKAHGKHYRVRPKSGWLLSFGCFGRHRGRSVRFLMACNEEKWICASVCGTMVQTNPTDKKMTSSTKIPNFSAFCKKKERLRHVIFHVYVLLRLQPNFEECRTIRESTEKKVKYTC